MDVDGHTIGSPECCGRYRRRVGSRVRNLVITADVFDENTMSFPFLLIPRLPPIPEGSWTTMRISRRPDGSLETLLDDAPLQRVQPLWHPDKIDILGLRKLKSLNGHAFEEDHDGKPAVAKVANFDWEIPRIERETYAYSLISTTKDAELYIPRVLGHIVEEGRPMGILLEMVNGRPATVDDLVVCERAVAWLHKVGFVHGDVNRFNFITNDNGEARMIEFATIDTWSEEADRMELEALQSCFADTSGAGAPFGYIVTQ
ncbi:hypothetical protein NQ176_g4151 [Zarea fungicola]|uniref:Uncharacterized protein n=1 Tax=Zarea fungicola TaxID=93591 RepID=A0ACC1NFS6_9HYPO|nr:hypothetical protein NQ176_g4151 [Lecanicillium fungicola]